MTNGRVGRRCAPLVALALVASLAVPGRATAQDVVAEVARLPAVMTNSTRFLAADTAARRLFEIGQPANSGGMWIAAYDLDSLARVALFSIPGADSGYGGRLAAVDGLRHRLFVAVPLRVAPVDDANVRSALGNSNRSVFDVNERLFFGIAVVDTLTLRVLGIRSIADVVPAPPHDTSFGNNAGLKALIYDANTDKLYLETEDATTRAENLGGPADHVVFVHQLDATRLLSTASSAVDWSYPVPACAMALTGGGSVTSVLLRTHNPPALDLPCRHNAGEAGGIARVNLGTGSSATDPSSFTGDFFAMPGALPGLVIADPTTDRLFLRVDAATGETGVFGFDARSGTWLGVTVTPVASWGLGVDPSRRRLYLLSAPNHAGSSHVDVVISASDATPTDQGILTRFSPHADPVLGRTLVDPIRHRIYWSTFLDYMVIEDTLPPLRDAPLASPDANTVDAAEGAGKAVNFFGGARAYGSRIRWTGGTRAVQQNSNNVVTNFSVPPLPREVNNLLPAGPADGTRDLHFARVDNATLSNGEAGAGAWGAQYDEQSTAADFQSLDRVAPDAKAAAWPYQRAHCADFGGGSPSSARTGASVTCSLAASSVSAASAFEQRGPAAIVIGRSTSSITTRRDPIKGIDSEARAEASDVQIGDQVLIGRVTSIARTWAHGRPGTAGADYQRLIEDVKVRQPDGSMQQVCTSPCRPALVADAVNRAPASRVRVDFPAADAARVHGTAGGYEALVVRDFNEQINNRVVNDEPDIRLEVPAVEVTLMDDSRVRSRVVVALAATSAESHYGIYLLATPGGAGGASAPRLGHAPAPLVLGATGDLLAPLPPASDPAGAVRRRVTDGLRFIVSTPGAAARSFGLWAFLVAPLVLAARRRRYGAARP
jgi:hypothetical protein